MRVPSLLALAVLLAGCNGAEIAELERIKGASEQERARLAQIAENLDQYRPAAEQAAKDLGTVTLWRSDGDPALRMKTFSARLRSARASYTREGADWRITVQGTGGPAAAMAALHGLDAPGLILTRIDASATTWSASLLTKNTDPPPDTTSTGAIARTPLPAKGLLPSSRSTQLRTEIERLRREIAELERLVEEVRRLEELTGRIRAEQEAVASDPVRLGRVLPVLAPLFSGRAPLLASGTVEIAPAAYHVRGAPGAGVTGETFAGRKPPGWELMSFESGTIQLSFTPKP